MPAVSAQASQNVGALQALWTDLNARYFRGALPPIAIEWSRRLTSSAGMFVSRMGPRSRTVGLAETISQKRLIRLSTPLLQRPSAQGDGTLVSTLAHEMIHQWQFDVLKRRPNHGPDFCRKMTEMNHDGMGITIRHDLQEALRALAKYVWRCQRCGRSYERQRRTIRPGRHQCGACRGTLREVGAAPGQARPSPSGGMRNPSIMDRLMRLNRGARLTRTVQLELNFAIS